MTIAAAVAALSFAASVPMPAGQPTPSPHPVFLPITVRPHGHVEQGALADTVGGEAPAWSAYSPTGGTHGFVLAAGRKLHVVSTDSATVTLERRVIALATDDVSRLVYALEALEEGAHGARRISVFQPDGGGSLSRAGTATAPAGSFDLRAHDGWLYVATSGSAAGDSGRGIAVMDSRNPAQISLVSDFGTTGAPEDLELSPRNILYVSDRSLTGEEWGITALRTGGEPPALSPMWRDRLTMPAPERLMTAAGSTKVFVVRGGGVETWADESDGPMLPVGRPVEPATPCLTRARDVAALVPHGVTSFALYGVGCIEWRAYINGVWEVDRSATDDRVFEVPETGQPFHEAGDRLGLAYGSSGGYVDWTGTLPEALELPGTARCLTRIGERTTALAGDGLWVLGPGSPEPTDIGVARLGFAVPDRCEIEVAGDVAYVAADDLFTHVDLRDPANPVAARASRLPRIVGALAADGRRSYLAAGEDGIFVRPHRDDDPIAGGVVRTAGPASDAELAVGHLYVADGPTGVTVFELAGDALPRLVGSQSALADLRAIRADGEWLYGTAVAPSGDHRFRLGKLTFVVFDISEPLKPELVGWLDLPGTVAGRPAVTPAGVLVPAGDALHLVSVTDPEHPRWVRTTRAPAVDAAGGPNWDVSALGSLGLGVTAP